MTSRKDVWQIENFDQMSISQLKNALTLKHQSHTLESFMVQLITDLLDQKRFGNAQVYEQALSKVIRYFGTNCQFEDIHFSSLRNFQKAMISEGLSLNTQSVYFRTIRAVFNRAIDHGIIPQELYPFRKFKIKTEATVSRALSKAEMIQLLSHDLQKNSKQYHARNFFLASFMLIGISFSDFALLDRRNLIGNRVVYTRQKTGRIYSIKIHAKLQEIIDLYSGSTSFLFPILPEGFTLNSPKSKNQMKQYLKTQNKYLKRIGQEIGLPITMTTYVSRHTWASLAKKEGYSNELIAEALGHSHGNSTTAIYLDRFENQIIDEANSRIIESIIDWNKISRISP